jgi:hypothetical protein
MSNRSLPRRPRRAQPDEAHLDDLLGFDEPPSAPPAPVPALARQTPWLVRSGLQAFALSAVVFTAFHIGGLAPPYPLILAVCAGAVLVRRAVGVTAEPGWQRLTDAVRPVTSPLRIDPAGWYEGGDGMMLAIRRWDRRMEWGAASPERFAATVLQHLRELADERLRLRHSITRASDPTRARGLLGEQLWSLLHEPTGRVPKPREIAAAADRLEKL